MIYIIIYLFNSSENGMGFQDIVLLEIAPSFINVCYYVVGVKFEGHIEIRICFVLLIKDAIEIPMGKKL